MRIFPWLLVCLIYATANAQNTVGIFSNHTDVGHPEKAGAAQYDAGTQTYTLKGGGYNIWFNRDEFQYAYKMIKGDFICTANFAFQGKGVQMHRKTGWMIRTSPDAEAAHITAALHGDGLTVLQWRSLRGAYMRDPEDETGILKKNFEVIQLERAGKKIIMRAAHAGEPLQTIGIKDMPELPDSVMAGIFICSHDAHVTEEAQVWNVRIDKPIPPGYNPYQEKKLGCRLEIMNVANGQRKVIYESPGLFEAPNFIPGGKKLLFNEEGSLYTIDINGGTPEKLNTGFADRNNNDHGISPNGKMLAISHHRSGLRGGGSTVYILPLEGGTPKQLTEQTPSYWHGWSPDSKSILFVAQRDTGSIYNIYKMNVQGGAETALTHNTSGHVDGPEYAPDGKYIYYNASATGTMQIWRMQPDGSHPEQMTFDEYNNWFPHISPDGKWMVFLSFPPDIDPADHPFCKRVLLRSMPLTGAGAPRVMAYIYGGQGTINVPSWSPDGKWIAFVSNSGLE